MNIFNLLKDIGKGVVNVAQFANKTGLVNLIPGGIFVTGVVKLVGDLNNAIGAAEITYKDVKDAGPLKKANVKATMDASLDVYEDVAVMRGEVFTQDEKLQDELIEAQLKALDLMAQWRASWKFTKKP